MNQYILNVKQLKKQKKDAYLSRQQANKNFENQEFQNLNYDDHRKNFHSALIVSENFQQPGENIQQADEIYDKSEQENI